MNTNIPLTPWSREQAISYVLEQNDISRRRFANKGLFPGQVEEIRELIADGMAVPEIAELFYVTPDAIYKLRRGVTHKRAAA